jgi:CubicO group peptidase (beta-lactamase class C family)
VLTAVLLLSLIAVVAGAQDSVSVRIDRFVRAEMQRQQIPGVAIGVVKGSTVVKAHGYGYANLEHQVPVRAATLFQSGSVGKQFTAVAVMLQVEDGKLSLSDPLTEFFPDAPLTWRSITVQHLLTHTSGIPDYEEGTLDYRRDYSEEELAKFSYALPLEFPAGARWNYSNTGYVLLGIIVHKVSGSFYGDVLAERVFKPLGMKTARVISEADIVPNRSAGYRLVNNTIKNQEWVSPVLNTTADGSLYFTVLDLIAWDTGIRNRTILKPESWNQILRPVQLNSGRTYPYGFGWRIDERGDQPLYQHGGSWQGFRTQFSRFVGEGLSVIVLANLAQANPERIADGIAEIMNPKLSVPLLRPIEDNDPHIRERLTRLLEEANVGKLRPSEFGYMRAGFFPNGAKRIQEQLRAMGPLQCMELVSKVEMGDDSVFTYEVSFANGTMYYKVALAPDGQVALFELLEK